MFGSNGLMVTAHDENSAAPALIGMYVQLIPPSVDLRAPLACPAAYKMLGSWGSKARLLALSITAAGPRFQVAPKSVLLYTVPAPPAYIVPGLDGSTMIEETCW